MAATSIADKLAKLEKKIAKRQATIAEEQTLLDKELAEYDRLYLTALASKYKLSGKDLFSAIEREHEQLEKLRDGGMSDSDIDSLTDSTLRIRTRLLCMKILPVLCLTRIDERWL